ncbi:hypothetical protein CDAR_550931 [Caerostris darwini]|uniref:Uncharacterized protein n=1 Tax=Caerostris darwini TaxID=1538125 RepID=A0AAV4QPW6_9ARAC|nr:hypothetical protein CDAR_550931 [Caerostris darwini]
MRQLGGEMEISSEKGAKPEPLVARYKPTGSCNPVGRLLFNPLLIYLHTTSTPAPLATYLISLSEITLQREGGGRDHLSF